MGKTPESPVNCQNLNFQNRSKKESNTRTKTQILGRFWIRFDRAMIASVSCQILLPALSGVFIYLRYKSTKVGTSCLSSFDYQIIAEYCYIKASCYTRDNYQQSVENTEGCRWERVEHKLSINSLILR